MKIQLISFFLCISLCSLKAQHKIIVPQIGIVENMENDSLLHAFGYTYLVESTQKILSPRNVSDQQFQIHLQKIKQLQVPLFACNIFLPGDLKVVGPVVDEQAILRYTEVVLQRAQIAGLKMIIWGSGGSRGIPEGFDRAKAKEQFIYMAKKIAMVGEKYNIILALENLNRTECNFINTLKEALEIVSAVDHDHLRLCADIYHMLKEDEEPEIIASAKKYIVYCEVAEKEGRTPPGVHQENFKPYLSALQKIGYNGNISIECWWKNVREQGNLAYQNIHNQIDEVYKN
ncbi:MAG TPA: sugar phosphate isomerase/epimerase family protein [Chryseolinea sp.]|nr:sugar phosphate isomerase/epimerase family protein [Chryseolinea sp.]HPM31037.1 sugar phosphate isomerase/epimerase family protein [Chryseolinea sp.]